MFDIIWSHKICVIMFLSRAFQLAVPFLLFVTTFLSRTFQLAISLPLCLSESFLALEQQAWWAHQWLCPFSQNQSLPCAFHIDLYHLFSFITNELTNMHGNISNIIASCMFILLCLLHLLLSWNIFKWVPDIMPFDPWVYVSSPENTDRDHKEWPL